MMMGPAFCEVLRTAARLSFAPDGPEPGHPEPNRPEPGREA